MASNSFDTRYIFGIIRRRFYLFAIPFLLASVIGTVVVMYLPAIYTASATVLVESQQIPEELVKSTITAEATERLQVIQQRVLTRENLLTIVDKFSLFKSRAGLSRSAAVDLMRQRIVFTPLDFQQVTSRRRNDRVAVAFAVEFSYENADAAMKVTNELITFIVEEDLKTRTERASDTTKFLERETQRLSTELALVQNQISEYKLQNNTTLPEKLAHNMSLLERGERELANLQRELVVNDEQQRLARLEASVRNAGGNLDSTDPLGPIRKKLVEAKLEYEVRKATFADSHPEMRMIKNSIAALERELESSPPAADANLSQPASTDDRILQEKLQSLGETRKVILDQRVKLESDGERLRAAIAKTPETGATLSVLERREVALQKSLDDMSTRFSQARLGERLEQDQRAEKFQVIEQPVLPQSPSKPNRPALLAAVAALAFGLGAATSTAAEFLDSTIRRSADIERQLRQRPLVVIPYIRTRNDIRKGRLRNLAILLGMLLSTALALLLVHRFYRPLDELFYKILERLPM